MMILKENKAYKYFLYLVLIAICSYTLIIILKNAGNDIKSILESFNTIKSIFFLLASVITVYFIGLYKEFRISIFILLLAIVSVSFNALNSYIVVLFFVLNIYLLYMFLEKKYNGYDSAILVSFAYIAQLVVISYFTWIMSHFHINYGNIYFIILTIQSIILIRMNNLGLKEFISNVNNIKLNTNYSNILILIIFTIFTAISYNIIFDSDSLIKHFFIPEYISLNGFFPYNVDEPVAFDISGIIPTYTYTFLYLIGGKGIFGLINLINFFMGIFLIKAIVEKYLGQIYGLITIVIIVFTPMMMLEYSTLFIDSFSFIFSSFIVYILIDLLYSKNYKYIILLFLAGNLSILSKLQMVYILIPIYIFIFVLNFRSIRKNIKWFLLILLITSLMISIPLIYNYIITENPLFPWYNGIFKSQYFWQENFKDIRWNYKLNFNILHDVTFFTSKFVENTNSSYFFGFHYLAILPLIFFIFISSNVKKFFILGLLFILSLFIMQYTTGLYMRYYLIILPLGTFLLVFIVKSVYDTIGNLFIKILFTLYLIFIIILNILFFTNDSILNYIYNIDKKPGLFLYNEAAEDFYNSVNKIVEPNSNVLSIIYLREKALYNYKLYSYNNYFDIAIRELNTVKSEDNAYAILNKYNIKYFILREDINKDFDNIYLKNIIDQSIEIFKLQARTGHIFILKKFK